ncbi:hypothetical protein E2C01_045803 [Portunus trituberculatus]|uniref:Uncharacterized protein n=1 Tax=Portunus trituberculatus TaxID=210409 RepID=A0A5B7G3C8_PORTR|nr:hypothetical protein [Portunus trituberculatus]
MLSTQLTWHRVHSLRVAGLEPRSHWASATGVSNTDEFTKSTFKGTTVKELLVLYSEMILVEWTLCSALLDIKTILIKLIIQVLLLCLASGVRVAWRGEAEDAVYGILRASFSSACLTSGQVHLTPGPPR